MRLLESRYAFGDNFERADLGTPALDLTDRNAGLRSVILIASVKSDVTPGTVVR